MADPLIGIGAGRIPLPVLVKLAGDKETQAALDKAGEDSKKIRKRAKVTDAQAKQQLLNLEALRRRARRLSRATGQTSKETKKVVADLARALRAFRGR